MAFEPSKFIKRQVHLQLMKVRNRNAADTLDQNAETIQKVPTRQSAGDVARWIGGLAQKDKTLKTSVSCLSKPTSVSIQLTLSQLEHNLGVHGNLKKK